MKILEKKCKHTGKTSWAVEYQEARQNLPPRTMRTSWTTYQKEAERWKDITELTGYCVSARPLPV